MATMLNVAFADDLSVQITREIKFSNGFGQFEGKPILKNVSKDIKVMGDYNVDEKSGNVVMKIDKVLYGGKIYDLSENFSTKRRLKNVKTAVLKSNAKIKLSGGSHPELLAILSDENTSGKKADGKGSGSSNSTASNSTNSSDTSSDSGSSSYFSRGYGSGSSALQNPYYYGNGSSSNSNDKSSSTTDSNGSCKSPEIKDGMAYVYPLIGGVCTQKAIAEANVYKKQNTSTCPNKTDYENMAVSIGEEQYAIIDDTEYRVKSCYYTDTIQLQSTTENCSVIPDYENRQGNVQKQYWYILNNERVNIGSCIPTGEMIPIYDDDYNSCKYRFDFENNVAIKQAKWYYIYENKRKNLGECVDVSKEKLEKMTYPMYENAQGCKCNEVDGAQLCQTKLSFNGMGKTKEDATECRYISAEGVELKDEFVGNYSFKDDSRQAVKKINQYFIGAGGEKVYVSKDKETNQSFPYKEMSCGWEHNNDKKLSYHKTKFIIKDPELLTLSKEILENNPKIQGDEYEIKDCSAVVQSVLYWQQQLELVKGKKTGEHKRQVLVPEELKETAKRWSLPMIKTKNASGVQIEAMLEDGEKPVFTSNFKANSLTLYNYEKWGPKGRWCHKNRSPYNFNVGGCAALRPPLLNLYYDNLTLEGVDNLPKSFTIGQIMDLHWDILSVPFYYSAKYSIKKIADINNPFTANSKISIAYSITLKEPIVIKPTKIDMNENIIEQGDGIFYKKITQNIIDQDTKQCVRYPESEFVLDSNGKKQCVGKQETKEVKENDKVIQKPKVDNDGNPICDNKGYKKHNDWNEAKKGQCKTQDVKLYTTGVTFTPNYDKASFDLKKQYCKEGESQTLEEIEEKAYEMPSGANENELPYKTDEKGNPIEKNNGESTYYQYIQKYKNDALNVNNYSKKITKVLCTADNAESNNMNAYIIGAINNHHNSKNKDKQLTKLEIESLDKLSLNYHNKDLESFVWQTKWKVQRKWSLGIRQWLTITFDTKKNWANNQTIYEHEMYRPFRRPDGSVFYLYERQGFFTNPPTIDCKDCARDDELNG